MLPVGAPGKNPLLTSFHFWIVRGKDPEWGTPNSAYQFCPNLWMSSEPHTHGFGRLQKWLPRDMHVKSLEPVNITLLGKGVFADVS